MSAVRIGLERPRPHVSRNLGGIPALSVSAAPPYVQSGRGRYIHRVRKATYHQYANSMTGKTETWLAAQCWCGCTVLLSKRKGGRFLATLDSADVACATCEGRAIGTGKYGTPAINGRYIRYQPRTT